MDGFIIMYGGKEVDTREGGAWEKDGGSKESG